MKFRLAAIVIVVTIAFAAMGCAGTHGYHERPAVHAGVSANYGYYDDYEVLSPHGIWVEASYGWAWCPVDVPMGWRPYTIGRWVYTDWGWMWLSSDPWGSLPYHYGRWGYDDYYGWVWVPGDVWAPAWVSWRYGSGWVGWAPLAPDVVWSVEVGLRYDYDDIDRRIARDAWCFVPSRDFTSTRLRARIAAPGRNVTLLSSTDRVTRYERRGSRPVIYGPDPDRIRRAVGHSIPQYRVEGRGDRRLRERSRVRGGRIEVFLPGRPDRAGKDDRVRATPPAQLRSRTPNRLIEREEARERRLERRMRDERARLQDVQRRENRNAPRHVSRAELRRRHQAEMRAQDQREARMRQVHRRRLERFKSRSDNVQSRDHRRGDERRPDQNRGHGRGRR